MELYDAMRTAFSARVFTSDPVPDETLRRIIYNARFAPSGGNRQGSRVIVVRSRATKERIAELAVPAAKRYLAQQQAGENPWNAVTPTSVSAEAIAAAPVAPVFSDTYRDAPVILVVCVDLKVVAAIDQDLPRVGLVAGASVYPFAWNILLAARNEGLGGTLTTMPILEEAGLRELLGLPEHVAVAAIIPMGKPVKQLTRLKRLPVDELVWKERWQGEQLD